MKKRVMILTAALVLSSVAFGEEIMYVTSPDGLRVRSEPSLSAKTINVLYYGEYVIVDKIGELATIDGITANWVKMKFYDEYEDPEANGWVFGGYLSYEQQLKADVFDFIKSYFERSKKDYYLAPYFPTEYNTFYYREEEDWENEVGYDCALESLCQEDYYPEREAVTIRECMYYQPPVVACKVGSLSILPAGTKIKLRKTGEYGIKDGVLFPIYWFESRDEEGYHLAKGYIRGIDITSTQHTSSVSDGKGGKYTLYYQRALKSVNSDSYGYSKEKIDKALNSIWTYEVADLKGGFKMNKVVIIDPSGKRYGVELKTEATSLRLEYPLNMKNPVLLLEENLFSGGMGGGYFTTRLSRAKLLSDGNVPIQKVFEYGYLSVDAGYDGMAYHYFKNDGAVVYEYQTDEMGNVEHNRHNYYVWKSNFRYSFWWYDGTVDGEPQGKSQTLEVGQYANPVCRLKMRSSPSLSAGKINTLEAGTLLQVVEVGSKVSIDGVTANWVKVKAVNDGRFVEGYSTNGITGWVFGGYLD